MENITTKSLRARFELLSTKAGIALGSPPELSALTYWLHRLFVDLRANQSKHTPIYNGTDGIIERLFETSAEYCGRPDRRSLEQSVFAYGDSLFERRPTNQRTVR